MLWLREDGELHVRWEAEAVAAVAESVAEDGEVDADEEGFVACSYISIIVNILMQTLEGTGRKEEGYVQPAQSPSSSHLSPEKTIPASHTLSIPGHVPGQ